MKKYCIVLKGHNYLLPFDGEPRKMGFTATRIVRANSPEEAEEMARRAVVRDPRLVRDLMNGSRDPSSLQVESVLHLGLFKVFSRVSQGFEFFFEDLPEGSAPTGENP